ncbi:MAG: cyclic pyranopterin monophosphate synthase MoaC [Lutimonas sp.]
MNKLSHLDSENRPKMVNVGDKQPTRRVAKAQAEMYLGREIMKEFSEGEIRTKKGAVFHTAIIAGIQGAKKTSDLIPLCHPLALNSIDINIQEKDKTNVLITCTVETEGKTGVEMEALSGAATAALTIYDMCKAISHSMIIKEVKLVKKTGGKSDFDQLAGESV